MDLSKFTLVELKNMRKEYMEDVTDLKNELNMVKAALQDPSELEIVNRLSVIRNNRLSKSNYSPSDTSSAEESSCSVSNNVYTAYDILKEITKIDIINMEMIAVSNDEENSWITYRVTARIDSLQFIVEYVSNKSFNALKLEDCKTEIIKQLNIQITIPNIQSHVQNGINFYSNNLTCISSAMLFLKKLNELYNVRKSIARYFLTEKRYIEIKVETNEHYKIYFKSDFDNTKYLKIMWSFIWDQRTCSAADKFQAVIILADDQLFTEVNYLLDELCSDKFILNCTEASKSNTFQKILIAVKAAENRNVSDASVSTS